MEINIARNKRIYADYLTLPGKLTENQSTTGSSLMNGNDRPETLELNKKGLSAAHFIYIRFQKGLDIRRLGSSQLHYKFLIKLKREVFFPIIGMYSY